MQQLELEPLEVEVAQPRRHRQHWQCEQSRIAAREASKAAMEFEALVERVRKEIRAFGPWATALRLRTPFTTPNYRSPSWVEA